MLSICKHENSRISSALEKLMNRASSLLQPQPSHLHSFFLQKTINKHSRNGMASDPTLFVSCGKMSTSPNGCKIDPDNNIPKAEQVSTAPFCHQLITPLQGGGKHKVVSQKCASKQQSSAEDEQIKIALERSLAEHKQAYDAAEAAKRSILNQLPGQLRYEHVLGDGNCLFRALQRGLTQIVSAPPDHIQIRAACVQAIRDKSELNAGFFDRIDFTNYVNSMAVDGTYGDELCIRAFCFHFNCAVTVFTASHGAQHFGNTAFPREIFLAHNGINHFDAVLLRHDAAPQPIMPEMTKNIPEFSSPNSSALNLQLPHEPIHVSCSSTDKTNDAPNSEISDTIKILSINVNSWVQHRDNLLDKADILVVTW